MKFAQLLLKLVSWYKSNRWLLISQEQLLLFWPFFLFLGISGEYNALDKGLGLINIPRRAPKGIRKAVRKLASLWPNENHITAVRSSPPLRINVVHNYQVIISFKAAVSTFPVTHIQKTTFKSTADCDEIDLIKCWLSVSWNPTEL